MSYDSYGFDAQSTSMPRGRGRGGGRGGTYNRGYRGSRGGYTGTPYKEDPPIPLETLKKGLGNLVAVVELPEMTESDEVEMTDFKAISSYNWMEGKSPSILVPGSPAVWNNPKFPLKLQADSEAAFVDQNTYRYPESPLLPMIKAIQHMDPDFDFPSIDIVTDRNNLRKLMRWLLGETKEFRIDCERIGDCLVLQRWETRTLEEARPGFGHAFELASTDTAPGCKGSTGHHRIVTYELDGLRFLVRCQVDACIKSTDRVQPAGRKQPHNDVDVALDLGSLSVSKSSDDTSGTSGDLKVIPSSNSLVPQSTMMEIKTRSIKNAATFNWDDAWPQLYLSQTKHIYLAIHKGGTFEELRTLDVDQPNSDMAAASEKAQRLLRGLIAALKNLSALTWSREVGERCSLVYHGGTMSVYSRESNVLPSEARELFQ